MDAPRELLARQPPAGPAIVDEGTRTALDRYALTGRACLLAGLVLVVIGALIDVFTPYRKLGGIAGAGIVFFVIAFNMLRRAGHWRGALTAEPWQPFRAEYLPSKPGPAEAGLLLVPNSEPSSRPMALKIDEVGWRQKGLEKDASVWVCGDPHARVVVMSPSSRALYAASAPTGYLGHKWAKAHTEELAKRGIRLPEAIQRRWLYAAILLFDLSFLFLLAVVGLVIGIASGGTPLNSWPVAVICAFLAVWLSWLAVRSWSKIAA